MATKLLYGVPGGGTYYASTLLTDSGDNTTFNFGTIEFLSGWSYDGLSFAPTVVVDGVVSGGALSPAVSALDNAVDGAILTANVAGTEYRGSTALAADTDLVCTRGGVGTEYIINSICHDGTAWSVIAGTGGAAFDLTSRGAGAGKAPLITAGLIEVGQVRFTTSVAAAVQASEIKQVKGDSQEVYNYPGGSIEYARLDAGVLGYAGYTFKAALPLIHAGPTPKRVYMTGYEETFAEWTGARNFAPQGIVLTSTTETAYNSFTKSSSDVGVSDGSMEWIYTSNVTDPEWDAFYGKCWFKYYEDTANDFYLAYQGIPSGVPANPATGIDVCSVSLTGGTAYLRVKSS